MATIRIIDDQGHPSGATTGMSQENADRDYQEILKKFERHEDMAADPTRKQGGEGD